MKQIRRILLLDLDHVRILDGKYTGQDRYVLPSDWYTQSDYARYAQEQKQEQLLRECTDRGADKNSDLNCDVERGSNEGMLTVWQTEDNGE